MSSKVTAAVVLLAIAGCTIATNPQHDPAQRKRAPSIEWPPTASEPLHLHDATSDVEIAFSVKGASNVVPSKRADGAYVYSTAIAGADLVQLPLQDGNAVEDFVYFTTPPAKAEVTYDVRLVRNVGGLRQLLDPSPTAFEVLDKDGTPRLRMSTPFVIDRDGNKIEASVTIEGCAVDHSSLPPWHRPTTPPGSDRCSIVIRWPSSIPYPAVLDPVWQGASSLGNAPYGQVMQVLPSNNRVLVASGYFDGQCSLCGIGPTTGAHLFDPDTRTWSNVPSLISARVRGAIAPLPSGAFLFVGGEGSTRPDKYFPATNSWGRPMDGFAPQPANLTATALINGKVLVAGGNTGGTIESAAKLFVEATDGAEPAGTGGAMTVARSEHTATVLPSNKVLIVGGAGTGAGTSAEIYDPVANSFTAVPNAMKAAHVGHIAAHLGDGKVLIAGGNTTTAEIYDAATNDFTAITATTKNRRGGEAVTLDSGRIMILGGVVDGQISNDVEIYDPVSQTFTPQTPMAFRRADFTAARIKNGDVLVVGGKNSGGYSIGNAEIWSPGAAGSKCVAPDDCRSGDCEEGICCAATCVGACKTCVSTTGECISVFSVDDPNSCTGANTCDKAGACKKKTGQSCATEADCASGFCVDGTCCDRACNAQCEACDVAGHAGTCLPVVGAVHGTRPACINAGTDCGGACNGSGTAVCAIPSADKQCSTSCENAKLAVGKCDGLGGCVVERSQPCPGNFVCEADGKNCKTKCGGDVDCATGYRCDVPTATCSPIALCSGSTVTKGTEVIDCTPYTCEQTGVCRTTCASVADCSEPNKVCSRDGRCIDPPAPIDDDTCSVSTAVGFNKKESTTTAPLLLLIISLLLLRRRQA